MVHRGFWLLSRSKAAREPSHGPRGIGFPLVQRGPPLMCPLRNSVWPAISPTCHLRSPILMSGISDLDPAARTTTVLSLRAGYSHSGSAQNAYRGSPSKTVFLPAVGMNSPLPYLNVPQGLVCLGQSRWSLSRPPTGLRCHG